MNETVSLRTETDGPVRSLILCRPDRYNSITPALARELAAAIEEADRDPAIRVMLLRAEGPAFCAGYGLDWAASGQFEEEKDAPAWDSASDQQMIGRFVEVYSKLWYASKPTIAAVSGWCICGGTDLVLWADCIIAADDAVFGYPTSRAWGVPTTPMWVYRIGFERAKRYLLTGDEIPAKEAAEIGLILEAVPAAELLDRAMGLARRMGRLPLNQLRMIKLYCNQVAENMGIRSTQQIGMIFDGVARHTQEGVDFVKRSVEVGFREAVRERDEPFGDYGSGPRSKRSKRPG